MVHSKPLTVQNKLQQKLLTRGKECVFRTLDLSVRTEQCSTRQEYFLPELFMIHRIYRVLAHYRYRRSVEPTPNSPFFNNGSYRVNGCFVKLACRYIVPLNQEAIQPSTGFPPQYAQPPLVQATPVSIEPTCVEWIDASQFRSYVNRVSLNAFQDNLCVNLIIKRWKSNRIGLVTGKLWNDVQYGI